MFPKVGGWEKRYKVGDDHIGGIVYRRGLKSSAHYVHWKLEPRFFFPVLIYTKGTGYRLETTVM